RTAGYVIRDFSNPWSYNFSELADLCVWAYPYTTSDGGFAATHVWSNTAAQADNGSPCIPTSTSDVYFNVSVDPHNTFFIDAGISDQTITFNVTGWSTASMSDWYVWAQPTAFATIAPGDLNPLLGGSNFPIPFNNGNTTTLTVTVPGGTPHGSYA